MDNCARALKQMVGQAEKKNVMVFMELLNSKVNHKDYMCDHTAWGVELVKRVGSDALQTALRHLSHADHGRRRYPHHPGQSPMHRPLPHRRRARPARDRRHPGTVLSRHHDAPLSTRASKVMSAQEFIPARPSHRLALGRAGIFAMSDVPFLHLMRRT